MNAVFKRVSTRKFEDRPVEQEKIDLLMKAAMAAPSATNQQPWEFYVVKDREVIRKLSETSPYAKFVAAAPLAIVVCARKNGLRAPEFAVVDCSIATENLLLEATELGLGCCWIGTAPDAGRIQAVNEAIGISPELSAFALVPVGYPAETKKQQDRYDTTRVHEI